MRRPRILFCLLLVLLLALPLGRNALAWSREGHMVTGAIAYARLREADPKALAAVLDLLRRHPHYEQLLRAPARWHLDPADADQALFMNAARWADDVRSGRFEDSSEPWWHFVNYHYRDGRLSPPGPPERDGFLLSALAQNRRRLTRGSTPERAVALTWMFHLVGDVHQPLHTIAHHGPGHPDGDRGGNLFFIRVTPGAETINLHRLWDNLLIGSDRFTDVRNRAVELRSRPGLRASDLARQVADLDFGHWAIESARLAVADVYRNGTLRSGSPEQGALLPSDYADTVRPIAERRAVLAGYRLAQLLSVVFGDGQAGPGPALHHQPVAPVGERSHQQ